MLQNLLLLQKKDLRLTGCNIFLIFFENKIFTIFQKILNQITSEAHVHETVTVSQWNFAHNIQFICLYHHSSLVDLNWNQFTL